MRIVKNHDYCIVVKVYADGEMRTPSAHWPKRTDALSMIDRIRQWYEQHTDEEIEEENRRIDLAEADRQHELANEKTPKRHHNPGVIYLIKCGDYHKIGKSENFPQRLIQLETQLPHKAKVIGTIRSDDPLRDEQWWHQRFADKRMNGEWFNLSDEDVSLFRSVEAFQASTR